MSTKRRLILTLSIVGFASAVAGAGVSYAAFEAKALVTAPNGVMPPLGTTVFLNPGIWDNGDGGAAFCVYAWASGKSSKKFISSVYTTSSGNLVFNLDLDYYAGGGFIFVRYNPTYALSSLQWNSAKEIIYNKTDDIAINSSGQIQVGAVTTYNTLTITGWGTTHFEDESHNDLGTIATVSWSTTADS